MIRFVLLIFCIFGSAGCVYRATDIPNVSYLEVAPTKVYIYTDGQLQGWQAASNLATDLQKAGFEPAVVGDLSEVNNGAYIIDQIEPWGKCFSEPMLTVLTLGIIPHIGCQEFGHSFMLHRKGGSKKVHVNASYTVKVMIGWLTWPAALSSDYAFTSTTVDVELRDETAISLLRRELANAMWHGPPN